MMGERVGVGWRWGGGWGYGYDDDNEEIPPDDCGMCDIY